MEAIEPREAASRRARSRFTLRQLLGGVLYLALLFACISRALHSPRYRAMTFLPFGELDPDPQQESPEERDWLWSVDSLIFMKIAAHRLTEAGARVTKEPGFSACWLRDRVRVSGESPFPYGFIHFESHDPKLAKEVVTAVKASYRVVFPVEHFGKGSFPDDEWLASLAETAEDRQVLRARRRWANVGDFHWKESDLAVVTTRIDPEIDSKLAAGMGLWLVGAVMFWGYVVRINRSGQPADRFPIAAQDLAGAES